jgi:hypothetical protein
MGKGGRDATAMVPVHTQPPTAVTGATATRAGPWWHRPERRIDLNLALGGAKPRRRRFRPRTTTRGGERNELGAPAPERA